MKGVIMKVPELCDECGGVVNQELKECQNCGKSFAMSKNKVILAVVVVALAIMAFFVGAFLSIQGRTPATDSALQHGTTEPKNGEVFLFPDEHPSAVLDIKTDHGEKMYFVLCSKTSGKAAVSFYVHAGNDVSIWLPAGEYDIYYASGEKWIGEAELFGEDTKYFSICTEISLDHFRTHILDLRSASSERPEIEKIAANRFP